MTHTDPATTSPMSDRATAFYALYATAPAPNDPLEVRRAIAARKASDDALFAAPLIITDDGRQL